MMYIVVVVVVVIVIVIVIVICIARSCILPGLMTIFTELSLLENMIVLYSRVQIRSQ